MINGNKQFDFSKQINDYVSSFSSFKAPSVDMSGIFAVQRRNAEAFAAAGQVFAAGVQAVSRRQNDLLRSSVDQFLSNSREILTAKNPKDSTSCSAEYARSVYESSVNNLREVSEVISKSSLEAFDVLNKRATESLQEISKVAA